MLKTEDEDEEVRKTLLDTVEWKFAPLFVDKGDVWDE